MKILVASEFTGLGSTGYSNYYKEICTALHGAGHEIVELASYGDNNDPSHLRYKAQCPWKVILNIPKKDHSDCKIYDERERTHGDAKFGAWAFDIIVAQEQPDAVLAIRDHWYDKFIIDSPAAPYYISVLCTTVDCQDQKGDWIDTFGRADVLTTYNEWSQNWLKTQYSCHNLVEYISPSAADEYKILDRAVCRKKLGIPLELKLVGTVMRNQGRKRFPELFEALSKCADTYLYAHTAYPDKGWDLPTLLLRSGIQDRVYFTYMCQDCPHYKAHKFSTRNPVCDKCGGIMATTSARKGLSNSAMANIYGCMDLYVQPANSEGFGVPLVEAAKCGLRCIATDYSAMSDVVRKIGGDPMQPLFLDTELETSCKRAVVDVKLLAKLINDPATYEYKREDIAAIYHSNYSWDKTGKKWVDLINKLKPKNKWGAAPQLKSPLSYGEVMGLNSNNDDFLLACVLYVACEPKLLGSYYHMQMLDNLNAGFLMSSENDGVIVPVDRKFVYNYYRGIRENINKWENQKNQINQKFQKN